MTQTFYACPRVSPTEAGATREVRLAVVCYGSSPLAIYMRGVTKELHRLVKARRCSKLKGVIGKATSLSGAQIHPVVRERVGFTNSVMRPNRLICSGIESTNPPRLATRFCPPTQGVRAAGRPAPRHPVGFANPDDAGIYPICTAIEFVNPTRWTIHLEARRTLPHARVIDRACNR